MTQPTDNAGTPEPNPDATPTESLQLPDQQPVTADGPPPAAAPAVASRGRHTRTILEVIGGVVAAVLIVVAGAAGFAVGHATGSDGDRVEFSQAGDRGAWGHDERARDDQGMGMGQGDRPAGRAGPGRPGPGHGPRPGPRRPADAPAGMKP